MPPYERPEIGAHLSAKFVRVERKIYVGSDSTKDHLDIVKADNLLDSLFKTRGENPNEVDAGWVIVAGIGTILIFENSTTLGLPVFGHEKEARKITIKDFKEQSPNHVVTELGK